MTRQRVVHAYLLGGPACRAVVSCAALYALDDEAVTCKRCLVGMTGPGRNSRDGPASQDRLAQTPVTAKRRESASRLALGGSGGAGGGP
jgi:hypothetical protein